MKATAEWFPAKRARRGGAECSTSARRAGSGFAPPLVATTILIWNWQAAFVVTGCLGLLWVVLWLLFYNSPSQHPALSDEEREYIRSGQEKHLEGTGRPTIGSILSQRNFWGIALPRFLADPTWGTLTFWLPLYLTTARHFDLKHIAMFAWLPFLAADFGCMFGGVLGLWFQKYFGLSLINARRGAFTVGAFLMVGVAFTGFVQNPYLAVALLSLAGFAHQTLSVTVITMSSDLFPRNQVATVAGMAGTFGNAGLLIFNLAIGALVTTIGYSPFFICLGVMDLFGAVLLWTLVREPQTT